jgi:hypothetical protein
VAFAERQFEQALEPKPKLRPVSAPSSTPRATVEPAALRTAALRAEAKAARPKPKPLVTVVIPPNAVSLTARALKVTLVLDAAQVGQIDLRDGQTTTPFIIEVAGREVRAQVSPKGLRKALGIIGQHGPDHVAVILQGKLGPSDVLAEAGLVAQVRAQPIDSSTPSRIAPDR